MAPAALVASRVALAGTITTGGVVSTVPRAPRAARDDSAEGAAVADSTRMTTPVAAAMSRTRRRTRSPHAPAALACPDVTGAGPARRILETRSRMGSSHG